MKTVHRRPVNAVVIGDHQRGFHIDLASGLCRIQGMTTIDEILEAVRSLPSETRGRLIPLIWDQLDPQDWPVPSSEWIAEAKRRSDLLADKSMVAEDWQVVRERARRAAGLSE
jgi:hypothetical protein